MTAFNDRGRGTLSRLKQAFSRFRIQRAADIWRENSTLSNIRTLFHTYRSHLLKGFTAVGLLACISIGGNEYMKLNMKTNANTVYEVYVNGQNAGAVSNLQVVADYIAMRNEELKEKNPNVRMVVDWDGIEFRLERASKEEADDALTLSKLDELIVPYALGTELIIDGKTAGIVKDEETAQQILEYFKNKYIPRKKDPGEVGILSAEGTEPLDPGESELKSAEIVQTIETKERIVQPEEVADPQELLKKLETGDVQPTRYTVEKGDCISCIAQKFNISKQVIYENNKWIQDDMIRVGDVLDLTVLQPAITVKTVETVVENQEIQYPTNYILDDSLRAGTVVPISPGKNGLKKVTYEVVKMNGLMQSEELIDEEIIEEPVPAVAKKGTKVVLGEGTGKFAWPVVSPTISSSFGNRWGRLHKGLDIVSKNRTIMAADNGKVVIAGYKSDYGNYVVIDHLNGYRTLYGHLSQINTSVGKIVEKGEKIGLMGSTGDATGVHLHFEVQRNGVAENPLKYLNR